MSARGHCTDRQTGVFLILINAGLRTRLTSYTVNGTKTHVMVISLSIPRTRGDSMRIITRRSPVLVHVVALALSLTACGGGGDGQPSYTLVVKSAELSAGILGPDTFPPDVYALLKGEGFLPPGSRCARDPSPFDFGRISFDELGPYKLTWTNTTTGRSGGVSLSWSCETAPTWLAYVPLAPGENRIVVSMSSTALPTVSGSSPGAIEQKAEVMVTRPT